MYVGILACCKNFGEPREFGEPIHLSDVYLPVHATRRDEDSEKQSITGYEIMTSIRLSTERYQDYRRSIVLHNANMQPRGFEQGNPKRR
jgi:predicted transcriptional regulator